MKVSGTNKLFSNHGIWGDGDIFGKANSVNLTVGFFGDSRIWARGEYLKIERENYWNEHYHEDRPRHVGDVSNYYIQSFEFYF